MNNINKKQSININLNQMKKLIFIIGILVSTSSFSQQLPMYSQYMLNGFLLNPAIAGTVDYTPVCLTAKQQWASIDNAPSTQAISAHSLIKSKNLGVGGYLFNDSFGPTGISGVQVSGSYHLNLSADGTKLALGLSFMAFQYTLDETNLIVEDQVPDAALTGAKQSAFVPDASFGAYAYNEFWYVGLSANNLVEFDIDLGSETSEKNSMVRHYFLHGGYIFVLSPDFKLEPSVLVKGTERSPFQADINIKGYYKNNYWAGFAYRSNKSLVSMIGLKIDKYYLGYAFDYTFSDLSNYSTGSHEIMLGINIGEQQNRGSSLL